MKRPLFWTKDFLSLQADRMQIIELSIPNTNCRLTFPFHSNGNILKSPGVGSFGGLYPSEPNLDWNRAWKELFSNFPKNFSLEVIFPPAYFEPNIFSSQTQSLIDAYQPELIVDVNHHVQIFGEPLALLSKGNRKKFRQFEEAGGEVRRGSKTDLFEAVLILEKSRERLGVKLSMSSDQIENALTLLPERYTLYIAKIGTEKVASALTVSITSECLYVLYWGDDAESWRHLSPVTALFTGIYIDAARDGYKVLDLGTSSVNGELNLGLARFKENLGAIRSPKIKASIKLLEN